MEDIFIIISKFLSGSATEEDKLELNNWRKADDANEQKYQELAECWQIMQADKHKVIPDKEKLWSKIINDINASGSNRYRPSLQPRVPFSRFRYIRTAAIAAVVALVIGFTVGKLPLLNTSKQHLQWMSMTSPSGGRTELHLADGTRVWLNSNSTLYYPSNFGEKARNVRLDGQAFFDVTKDKTRQFSVSVAGIKVNVLGTAFDINGYRDNDDIEVVVHRGHVNVVNGETDNMLADLHANEKTVVDRKSLLLKQTMSCDVSSQSLWRFDVLKIEGENLHQVARKLADWYGVHIDLSRYNANKLYWITIKTESLRETLNLLDKINPISYHINGKEVNIREKH